VSEASARSGKARIDKLVTSGVFSLDGQNFDVDNNVWLVGDDSEVFVIDAAHEPVKIQAAIGTRRLLGVISTHGHNDHINAAVEVAGGVVNSGIATGGVANSGVVNEDPVDAERSGEGAPIYLHPDDRMLWDMVNPEIAPEPLADGQTFEVAGVTLTVLHTPGHSPGAVCLSVPELDTLISGDTLFCGGPGATGRSFSSFPTILDSIRTRLLTLPPSTTVLTGHGDSTTIGAEAADYDAWVARGH
jgi:glyoxylase-like metal-dependent hydrolase (beta-lactamase superfamily II)